MVVNAKDVTDSVGLSDPYPLMPTHSCPRLNFHTFLYLSLNLNQAPLGDGIKTEFNIPCHSLFTAVLVSGKRPIALNPLQFEVVDGEEIVGSLSNYDDDHNDDFKKTIGLMIKTTALHVHHAF